jgi:hypothetical protein
MFSAINCGETAFCEECKEKPEDESMSCDSQLAGRIIAYPQPSTTTTSVGDVASGTRILNVLDSRKFECSPTNVVRFLT